MKLSKQWWNWAVIAASLAFALQVSVEVKAQDAQVTQDSGASQGAQDQNGQADEQDPPSRIARLNYMQGSVSFQPGGENEWIDAAINRPLVAGDNLWADENSRVEVHIGSTALRLGAKTGITLLEVSDRAAQIRLVQGSLIVKVRHVDGEDSYEVDTPNVAFIVMQPGDYRIDVDADGNRTEVTVWRGRGQVTGGGNSYTVVASQHATFSSASSGADQLNYDFGQIPAGDGFDSWALDRDQVEERSDSANYVSREMTGYEDLDEYGTWSYVAGYGTCWQPRGLAVGWAPYRFGHWIWVTPWGWTWVEDEPWGFAPFHYGRWALAGAGWVWVPGPRMVRPVYAPALVAWVGGGPGFRFSVGAGVGWLPLAPGEVFLPGYRVSSAYVNSVNVTNTAVSVTRVANVYNDVVINRNVNSVRYANRNVSGGMTVVSRDTFVNARPVARNVVSVPAGELAGAPVSHGVAIEPMRSSVLGAGRAAVNKPPASVINRPVVALRSPAPMPRSFDQRQAQAGGHLNQQSVAQSPSIGQSLVRQEAPGRPVPVTRQPQMWPQDGVRSFGQANSGSSQTKPQPRVWEEQGTVEPEKSTQAQSADRSPQRPGVQGSGTQGSVARAQPAQQWSHSLAKPGSPVQQRNEQQQREQEQEQKQQTSTSQQPRPAAPHRQQSAPAPRSVAPPAKGH
jgi:FecR protein